MSLTKVLLCVPILVTGAGNKSLHPYVPNQRGLHREKRKKNPDEGGVLRVCVCLI